MEWFKVKTILVKQKWFYLTNNWVNKDVDTFPSSKVNEKWDYFMQEVRESRSSCVHIYIFVYLFHGRLFSHVPACLVGWGYRIHQLLFCKWVSVLIMTLWWRCFSNTGVLVNVEYSSISIAPMSTLARSGSTWEGPIYRSNRTKLCTHEKSELLEIELFWHWNCTHAKLNCLK